MYSSGKGEREKLLRKQFPCKGLGFEKVSPVDKDQG